MGEKIIEKSGQASQFVELSQVVDVEGEEQTGCCILENRKMDGNPT